MSVVAVDPGDLAEHRAQRRIGARDRRRALLVTAQPALRLLAFGLFVAGACGVLYGWARPLNPVLLLVVAVAVSGAARLAGRVTPASLSGRARAEATVREAWRVLRADADEPRPYPRHAVWATETDDGTVDLWRLTRPAGDARADDGGYAVTATFLRSLDPLDTVAAAEAMADAQADAERDERAELRIEARGLARALRS